DLETALPYQQVVNHVAGGPVTLLRKHAVLEDDMRAVIRKNAPRTSKHLELRSFDIHLDEIDSHAAVYDIVESARLNRNLPHRRTLRMTHPPEAALAEGVHNLKKLLAPVRIGQGKLIDLDIGLRSPSLLEPLGKVG